MDGIAFSAAANLLLSRLQQVSEALEDSQNMQSVARFIPYLIQGSPFRLPYQGRKEPSDGVCSFAKLVDMFHKCEASKIHDKVYALLALSTEDMGASGLLPDYTIPFGELLERVVSMVISDKVSVNCQDSMDAAVIKTTGYVLATIQRVTDHLRDPQLQMIDIKPFDFTHRQDCRGLNNHTFALREYECDFDKYWYIQASAIPLRQGDVICHLDGAVCPTIIRVCQDYSIILVAAVSLNKIERSDSEERLAWQEHIENRSLPKRDFSLVWDWSYSSSSHYENFADWAQSKPWI